MLSSTLPEMNCMGRLQPHAIPVTGGERPPGGRHVVVVEHHEQRRLGHMAGVVDCLQGHATRERTVTDDCHTFVVLTLSITGHGHAQSRRDGRAGVTCTEVVKTAFAALQITGNPSFLSQGIKIAVAASDQLVGIGLVADVPDHTSIRSSV